MGSVVAESSSVEEAQRIRLHITPFNAELLDRFVPPAIRSQASDISFHTVQTFPERGFGYVELPKVEAQKIRQKLNGMTLKGSKVKIEVARPEKSRKDKKRKSSGGAGDSTEVVEQSEKATKRVKRAKAERGEGIIPGHELDPGRIVKRGWQDTNPKKRNSKKDEKSGDVSLEGKSNHFKTSVAPNAMPLKASKKETKGDVKKKDKEKKTGKHDVVVKEFKNTTKILNAKSAKASKPETHYEDGVGWVDGEGNVIEAEAPSSRRKRAFLTIQPASKPEPIQPEGHEEVESSESVSEAEEVAEEEAPNKNALSEIGPERSSSEAPSIAATATSIENPISAESEAESPSTPPTEAIPPRTISLPEREIHPLEALYKRPASSKKSNKTGESLPPIDTGFSFFGGGDAVDSAAKSAEVDSDDDEDRTHAAFPTVQHPPHTPHTKLDLEWRGLRSGAPTPDTAAIGKRFTFPISGNNDNDDDENGEDDDEDEADDDDDEILDDVDAASPSTRKAIGGEGGDGEESEFRKWFYENRGELNRGWKKRRREEKKLKRQRESRRLGRKIA
jgi:hypothetical protein